jgi:hypothetical protein
MCDVHPFYLVQQDLISPGISRMGVWPRGCCSRISLFSSSSGHGLSTVVNLVFGELIFCVLFSFCSRVVQAQIYSAVQNPSFLLVVF